MTWWAGRSMSMSRYDGKNAYAVGKMWGATCPAYITGGNTVFGGIDDKAGGTNISIHTYKAIRRLVV